MPHLFRTRHLTLLALTLFVAAPSVAQKKPSLAELAAMEWKLEQGSNILTQNPDVAARTRALADLASLNDSRTAAPLSTAMREDPDAAVRLKAAEALAALKTPEAKGLLTVTSTSDPDEKVRQTAKLLLQRFPKRMMVATLPLTSRPFKLRRGQKVDAPLLQKTVTVPSGDARLWAVQQMKTLSFKGRAALLEQHMFQDPSARVRAESAKLLAALGKRKSLPLLIRGVSDGNPLVRFEILRLIAEFDDPGALSVVQKLASSDDNENVKGEARDLLEPTTPVGKRLLNMRIKKLSSSSELERIAALNELATVSHWRAMRPMSCTLLNDKSVKVRTAAATVLTRLHDSSILTAMRVEAVMEPDNALKAQQRKLVMGMRKRVDGLIKQLQSKEVMERVVAARFLGQAAYPQGLEPLIAALKDKDARVRLAAATGLTSYSDTRAATALKVAGTDPDPRVRKMVDRFFRQQIRLQKYRAFFKDSNRVVMKTADKDPRWRRDAALTLGISGANTAVATLAQLALHDKDEQVRLAAAWSLVLMASERGELALKSVAAKDPGERVRLTARKYLVIDKISLDDLVAQMSDPSASVRQDAAEALSLRPRSQILYPMIKASVCDPSPAVRSAAMRALARIGNPLAQTAIQVALTRDPDKEVRRTAYMMYILAGGK